MCTKGPLTIGDDCWIGTRVTILDGAQSVGDRALVAACALVIKPVPPRAIVGGVPAKVLRGANIDNDKQ
jgi:acetyltransferase-like isoleucine patch superfamily enzyme